MWISPRSLSVTAPERGRGRLVERSELNPRPGVWIWGALYIPFEPPLFSPCPKSGCIETDPSVCRHGKLILEGSPIEEWPHACPGNHSRQVGPGSCPKEKVKDWSPSTSGGPTMPKSWMVCGADLEPDELYYWDEISKMFNTFPKTAPSRVILGTTSLVEGIDGHINPLDPSGGFENISKTSEDLFLLDFPTQGFVGRGTIMLRYN